MAVTREDRTNSKLLQLLAPVKIEANKEDIPAADLSGFDSALITVNVGASDVDLGDNNQLLIEMQESNDNVTFTDCSATSFVGSLAGFDISTIGHLNTAPEATTSYTASYVGNKRYVRPVIRCAGAGHGGGDHHGTMIGISAMLRGSKYRPTRVT